MVVRRKPTTVTGSTGNHIDLLIALRTKLANAIDDPDIHPRDLAPLARRIIEIDKEIQAMSIEETDPIAAGLRVVSDRMSS